MSAKMLTEVLLSIRYLWGPAGWATTLPWLPLWLMSPGVSSDLSSAQLRVSDMGPISAKHWVVQLFWTVRGAVPFQFAFFATVQLRLSRWCWWSGGWLCCLYASARPWLVGLDGGRFLGSRMLELRCWWWWFFQFEAAQSSFLRVCEWRATWLYLNRRSFSFLKLRFWYHHQYIDCLLTFEPITATWA